MLTQFDPTAMTMTIQRGFEHRKTIIGNSYDIFDLAPGRYPMQAAEPGVRGFFAEVDATRTLSIRTGRNHDGGYSPSTVRVWFDPTHLAPMGPVSIKTGPADSDITYGWVAPTGEPAPSHHAIQEIAAAMREASKGMRQFHLGDPSYETEAAKRFAARTAIVEAARPIHA